MTSTTRQTFAVLWLASAAARAWAQQIPNITYAGPTQPGWGYASPPGVAVVWFSADQSLPADTPLKTDSYMTLPGGAITDIIRDSAQTVTIRGYVPASDSFESNTTSVQLSSKACALQPQCTATAKARNAPACNIYAVDMSFSGLEGLVTDKDSAMLVVGCSAPVSGLCYPAIASCVYVDGPLNATTDYISDTLVPPTAYYNLQVSWEAAYTGPVIVSIDCPLTDARGVGMDAPMPPLEFSVRDSVPVRSTGYRIGTGIA